MSSDNQAKRACVALSQSAKLNPKKNLALSQSCLASC